MNTILRSLIAVLALQCFAFSSLKAQTRPPVPISQPAPEYPASLKEKGITGTVVFTFIVTKDGNVLRVKVVESPNRLMSQSVVRAVRNWKFEPPMKDGRLVNSLMRQQITFSIKEGENAAIDADTFKTEGEPGATDNPDNVQ